MSNEVSCTENQIIEKSKELFFKLGKIQATNQEIADFSGVQRTLVNYYFRSKENLVKIVFGKIIDELHAGLKEIYLGEYASFEDKVDHLIDYTFSFRMKYPFFEVLNVIRANDLINQDLFFRPTLTDELNSFLNQVQEQMDEGNIRRSNPVNFLINILSLVSFPLVMRGIFRDVFGLSEKEFDEVIKERKQVIKNLIFNK